MTTSTTSPRRRSRGLAAAVAVVATTAMLTATSPVAAKVDVGTSDLANGAVTTPKLAKNAVTAKKIRSKAVTRAKLKPSLRPMWAVVWGGPTIDRGRGAVDVSTVGASSFSFQVEFNRRVANCAYTATLSTASAGGAEQIGMASVAPYSGDPKSVLVVTRDQDGVGAARGFTVRVDC